MSGTNNHNYSGESGATMVQAALALPLFLALLFGSIRILLICYQGIRFQYEVSETTRMTFTLDKNARGGKTWQGYFSDTFASRARNAGLSGLRFETSPDGASTIPANNITVNYIVLVNGTPTTSLQWPGNTAKPGDTFSVQITSSEPLIPNKLGGIASPSLVLTAKAVAMIHRAEDE
jgi:Flp pilus assembly protein TadG